MDLKNKNSADLKTEVNNIIGRINQSLDDVETLHKEMLRFAELVAEMLRRLEEKEKEEVKENEI